MQFKVGKTDAFIEAPSSLLLKAGQWNDVQFTVTNKGESKLKLKVGISHQARIMDMLTSGTPMG
jgi:hypothetical protein